MLSVTYRSFKFATVPHNNNFFTKPNICCAAAAPTTPETILYVRVGHDAPCPWKGQLTAQTACICDRLYCCYREGWGLRTNNTYHLRYTTHTIDIASYYLERGDVARSFGSAGTVGFPVIRLYIGIWANSSRDTQSAERTGTGRRSSPWSYWPFKAKIMWLVAPIMNFLGLTVLIRCIVGSRQHQSSNNARGTRFLNLTEWRLLLMVTSKRLSDRHDYSQSMWCYRPRNHHLAVHCLLFWSGAAVLLSNFSIFQWLQTRDEAIRLHPTTPGTLDWKGRVIHVVLLITRESAQNPFQNQEQKEPALHKPAWSRFTVSYIQIYCWSHQKYYYSTKTS